tara:strand:- start:35 stop:226 length:192 start_codon:yes stop_codon:yes gene_type:complete
MQKFAKNLIGVLTFFGRWSFDTHVWGVVQSERRGYGLKVSNYRMMNRLEGARCPNLRILYSRR